jgi:hypothetical protein
MAEDAAELVAEVVAEAKMDEAAALTGTYIAAFGASHPLAK